MGLLAGLWNIYLGLLAVIGHAVLVLTGIALCGYATVQQLEVQHNTQTDVVIFLIGILLVTFSTIRRILWTFAGLAAIWGAVVWFAAQALTEHDHSFQISPELIAIAVVPALLLTLFMEATRRRPTNEPELEISLSSTNDNKP